MYTPDPVATTVAALSFLAAVFERLKSSKKENKSAEESALLSDAKMHADRAASLTKLANDNLDLYKAEHADHIATRQFWHDEANKFNVTLLACQEKLQVADARPDYSQLMVFIKDQSTTSLQILVGIKEIIEVLKEKTSPTL